MSKLEVGSTAVSSQVTGFPSAETSQGLLKKLPQTLSRLLHCAFLQNKVFQTLTPGKEIYIDF